MIMTYHERRTCNERTQTIVMGLLYKYKYKYKYK